MKEEDNAYKVGFLKGSIKVMSVALSLHCRRNNIFLPTDVSDAIEKISEDTLELCEKGEI
tara:strand:- start:354 stop:533 length:180 start_codon:yes stop_codon:yes gene_type:complete